MKTSFFALAGARSGGMRAGELRLLIVAVTLAVEEALTAVVGFLPTGSSGRDESATRASCWAATPVSSDKPDAAGLIERARALGLQSVTTLGFPTMGRAPDAGRRQQAGGAQRWWTRAIRCVAAWVALAPEGAGPAHA